MPGVAFDTAATIISDAAIELGLASAAIADPIASTNKSILQLVRLLTRVGRDLVKERAWSHLQKRVTFNTSNGDNDYDLAADFDRYIDGTGWDQTSDLPLGGPLNAQDWEYLQAHSSTATVATFFRIVENEMWLFPTPGATAHTIAYGYVSSYWARATASSAPDKTRITVSSDVVHFDPTLVVHALKVAWLESRGFDASAAKNDYGRRLAVVTGSDGSAPIINLSRPSRSELLGPKNIPDTGYGS